MKITVWTSAVNLKEALSASELSAIESSLNDGPNYSVKSVTIKNYTTGTTLYIEQNWITATPTDGFPIEYLGTITFNEQRLQDISLISSAAGSDVRLIIN